MLFNALYQLQDPIDVVLGDGRALTAVGRGEAVLDMILPNGESRSCMLRDVLYVPKLSYNLLSVAKASQGMGQDSQRHVLQCPPEPIRHCCSLQQAVGKKFTRSACYILTNSIRWLPKLLR